MSKTTPGPKEQALRAQREQLASFLKRGIAAQKAVDEVIETFGKIPEKKGRIAPPPKKKPPPKK